MSADESSRNGPGIEANSHQPILLGEFCFDVALSELSGASGEPVNLRSQSLEVLRLLANEAGKVVTKDSLIEAVWGETFVTDDSLVQCISDIRRAIGDRDHKMIQTLPRRGYRLNAGRATPLLPTRSMPDLAKSCAIAVLPFTSLSDDREQQYFAEGLSEDLIVRLSMVRSLVVLAAPSNFSFGGDFMRAEDAGTEFGPEYLIKGTVRRSGDMVRVTVHHLNYQSGTVIQSRRYDRHVKDIFEIQDDIASEIITETRVALTDGEVARLAIRRTRSVQAWEYFHQGVLEHIKYTPENNQAARRLYQKALEIDPNYYDAMVADGWAIWQDARSSPVVSRTEALDECRSLVERLIARWPDHPDTLHLDAVLLMMEGKHDAAQDRADQARAAGRAYLWGYAIVHIYGGSVKKAAELFRQAISTALVVNDDALFCYAHCLTLLGQYKQAIILAEEYRLRVPTTAYGFTLLATIQALDGQAAAAADTIAEMRDMHPQFTLAMFRRHEPYRDADTLDLIIDLLRQAGMPD